MRVLDLFCGAGGAAMGIHQACVEAGIEHEIVGVDIKPQPRYPFEFVRADAMTYPMAECSFVGGPVDGFPDVCDKCGSNYSHPKHRYYFDFVWASPPCEHYSQCTPRAYRRNHDDLIGLVRQMLEGQLYWVIENVPSARKLLRNPLMLCGSMFGLGIRRHRFFELHGIDSGLIQPCQHKKSPVLITGTHRRTYEPRYEYTVEQCRHASGIDWMIRKELDKAIPPAYSKYIFQKWLAAQPASKLRQAGPADQRP